MDNPLSGLTERPPNQMPTCKGDGPGVRAQFEAALVILTSDFFRTWLWARAEAQRVGEALWPDRAWDSLRRDYQGALRMVAGGLDLDKWRDLDPQDPIRRVIEEEYNGRVALLSLKAWFDQQPYGEADKTHAFFLFVCQIMGGLPVNVIRLLNPYQPH